MLLTHDRAQQSNDYRSVDPKFMMKHVWNVCISLLSLQAEGNQVNISESV